MKRKILLSIILLSGLLLIVRVCNPPLKELNGVFEFKLGMSIKDLKKITGTAALKRIENIPEKNIQEIFQFSDKYYDELIRDKRVKAYHLDNYTSDDNCDVKDIELYFFDDQLYRVVIKHYDPIIEEWLDKKEASNNNMEYVPPQQENEDEPKTGEYDGWWQGEKKKVTSRTKTLEWETNNDNIKCKANYHMNSDYALTSFRLILMDEKLAWMASSGDLSEDEKNRKEQRELDRKKIKDEYFGE